MMNNLEVLEPYEGIAAAADVVAARARRRRTALVEGEAWRGPSRQLLVLRVEAFADDGVEGRAQREAHREAWQAHGRACLLEMWRRQWSERDVTPGWIDVRPRIDAEPEDHIDWFSVEDHTSLATRDDVAVYQHLSVWAGRGAAVVTMRHLVDTPQDDAVRWFAAEVARGMARLLSSGNDPDDSAA